MCSRTTLFKELFLPRFALVSETRPALEYWLATHLCVFPLQSLQAQVVQEAALLLQLSEVKKLLMVAVM